MIVRLTSARGRLCRSPELDDQAAALRAKSKLYLKDAKQLSWQAFYQKYAPLAVVALLILVFIYWRFV